MYKKERQSKEVAGISKLLAAAMRRMFWRALDDKDSRQAPVFFDRNKLGVEYVNG